jgi:hypothetical protein
MTHVEHDTLWAVARDEFEGDAASVQAHLAQCADCQAQLEDVRAAQAVLFALPEPTPMPDAVARRVGAALAEEVDRRAARSLRSWWTSLFEPRFAMAFAAAVALVALLAYQLARAPETTQPVAHQDDPAVVTPPSPTPVVPTPPKPSVPEKKLTASVASARKAKVSKSQVLSEGSTVATEAGGSAWLRLPDGSRAGLTGSSSVTLAKLEEHTLALEVTSGNLALVVPHREDRLLTVRAGDVLVKDLGTSFLVSRTGARVLVAVDEGSVEVTTPTATRTVTAGHALTWEDGKLDAMKWETTPPPADKRPVVTPSPAQPEVEPSQAARLNEDDDQAPPEVEPAVTAPTAPLTPEEWAQLPAGTPPPPPGPVTTATPPPTGAAHPAPPSMTPPKKEGFSLSGIERRLKDLQHTIEAPFAPSESMRENRARDVNRLADAGDCVGALAIADRWLVEPMSRSGNEGLWRRAVLNQKVRCLMKLGRVDEANAVKVELER